MCHVAAAQQDRPGCNSSLGVPPPPRPLAAPPAAASGGHGPFITKLEAGGNRLRERDNNQNYYYTRIAGSILHAAQSRPSARAAAIPTSAATRGRAAQSAAQGRAVHSPPPGPHRRRPRAACPAAYRRRTAHRHQRPLGADGQRPRPPSAA